MSILMIVNFVQQIIDQYLNHNKNISNKEVILLLYTRTMDILCLIYSSHLIVLTLLNVARESRVLFSRSLSP